jgi:hypothetical protein
MDLFEPVPRAKASTLWRLLITEKGYRGGLDIMIVRADLGRLLRRAARSAEAQRTWVSTPSVNELEIARVPLGLSWLSRAQQQGLLDEKANVMESGASRVAHRGAGNPRREYRCRS